ncbi:PIN domain-containing protein [Microbacterium sp. ARD31]|uniref:PIN domain-containing protein n=1 Tax=Microbacterium sp. ARD31 TaxID=2962576 RepID=UPI002881776B|nr:PIN domain-containing protein [Microbacterium sp. ARD31]MDT0181454.1 PIN domain-containing protein [Microbacterium sp. ARD31]
MASPTLILLDTTAFSQDSMMRTAAWDSLASAAKSGLIKIAISEVTILELGRQVLEKAEKLREAISSNLEYLESHGVALVEPEEPRTQDFEPALRARLATRHVHVLPLPSVSHADLVSRDIATRPPFNRSGKGYRDALIWHSLLEWIGAETDVEEVLFVTANTTDFAEKGKNGLAADLSAELPAEVDVQLIKGMSEAAAKVRELKKRPVTSPGTPPGEELPEEATEPARSAAERAAKHAFLALADQEWESIDAFPFQLQPVESVSVTWVEIDEGTLEAELVDTVSETMIWDVRASARLSVEGMVYRGEAFVLGKEWDVSPGSFEEHYVEATRTIECTLVVDVRVEADNETAEAAITDILVTRDEY